MIEDEKEDKTEYIVETDATVEAQEKPIADDDEDESKKGKGDIEIGTYNSHLSTAKKGMYEFKTWPSLTIAVVHMAAENSYHRIDIRDKETLARLEKDLDTSIDYNYIDGEIAKKPWLIRPNGVKGPVDKTRDGMGKPLTKKAMKENAKRDKFQTKIDALKAKRKAIKNKKGPRAAKLEEKINELEMKRDRV